MRISDWSSDVCSSDLDARRAEQLLRADLARGGASFARTDPDTVTRVFPARASGYGKLNVVVIPEESFGAEFIGSYGDRSAESRVGKGCVSTGRSRRSPYIKKK